MIFLLILLFLFQSEIPCVYATQTKSYYARIMQEDVYLYKDAVAADDFSNIYFTLPATYFVELIDETTNGFFKVNYLNFTGYVKKECVQTIVGSPLNPYLTNISFRVYSEQSRDLRSEPTTTSGSSSQVAYIPLLNRNLTYFGSIVGEQVIDGRTSVWYYCKYSADKEYYGYVYSDFCDELTPITPNTETVTYTTNPNFSDSTETPTALPLEHKATGIIIAILCLPACAFLFMIFRNKYIVSGNKIKSKEVVDY